MRQLILIVTFLIAVTSFGSVKVGDSASYQSKDVNHGVVWTHSYTLTVTKVNGDGSYTYRYDWLTGDGQQASGNMDVAAWAAKADSDYHQKLLGDCAGNGGVPSHKTINGVDLQTCVLPNLNAQGVKVGKLEYADIPFYSIENSWIINGDSGQDVLVSFHK